MTFNVILDDINNTWGPRDDVDAWCRQMWNVLTEGGSWALKRSGLIFTKRDGKLVLTARMPHMVNMPITHEQLIKQQFSDYKETVEHFGRVGVVVEDQTAPSGPPS